jgi:hypothetical protein
MFYEERHRYPAYQYRLKDLISVSTILYKFNYIDSQIVSAADVTLVPSSENFNIPIKY